MNPSIKLMLWWPRLFAGWLCGYFGMEVALAIFTSLAVTAAGEWLVIGWTREFGQLPLIIIAALFYAAMGVDCRSRLWRRGVTWL